MVSNMKAQKMESLNLPMSRSKRVGFRNGSAYLTKTGKSHPKTWKQNEINSFIGTDGIFKNKETLLASQKRLTKKTKGSLKKWQRTKSLVSNHHDITKIPYESRRGLGGAYWRKLNVEVQDLKKPRPELDGWKFYDLPRETERFLNHCNRHKGIFLSNARERRSTTRNMITDLALAHLDPSDMSPMHYNPRLHTIAYNAAPRRYSEKPNPHLFLQRSYLPEKVTSYIPRHQSFLPGVGRYDIRFQSSDVCNKAKSMPTREIIDWSGGGNRKLSRLPETKFFNYQTPAVKKRKLKTKQDVPRKLSKNSHTPTREPIIRFNTNIQPWKLKVNFSKIGKPRPVEVKYKRRVQSRLFEIPNRLRPICKIDYKRFFKFLALPEPKILFSDFSEDLRSSNTQRHTGFYNKEISYKNYLKKDAKKTQLTDPAIEKYLFGEL